jgi:creatinine amidohydrolase
MPFGALEAHGPHLPLGADYLVAEEVALRASRAADAIVAPTMPYGYSSAFRGFAGNVSTRMEITQMLAEDVVTDLAAAGATHFIFVDNHAGNDPPLEAAARSLQERLGVAIAHFYPWKVMTTWGAELYGNDWKAAYGHGAEPNTSVLLYLMPDAVSMERAVAGGLSTYGGKRMASSRFVEIEGVQHQVYVPTRAINDSSVTAGDPRTRPDAQIGRAFVERCTESLVQLITWFRAQQPATAGSPR